jgi:hypothetical protein
MASNGNGSLVAVNSKSSKAAEIELLRGFVAKYVGEGSFLASLFTPEMLKWVDVSMQDDVCPDLLAGLEHWHKQANELAGNYVKSEDERRAAAQALKTVEHDLAQTRATIESLVTEKGQLERQVTDLRGDLKVANDAWHGMQESHEAALERMDKAEAGLATAERTIADGRQLAAVAWLEGRAIEPDELRDALKS